MQIHIHRHRTIRTNDDYASAIKATLPEIVMGDIIREYNEPALRNIIDRLRSDKSVSVSELKDIIRNAFGQISVASTRSGLIDQILKEFIQQARFANKIRR